MEHKYNKGSEWRKWDLHIHTPYSIYQNYGGTGSFDKFIDALERLPKDVKVIGITDYYFIDGYEKVMEYRQKGRLSNIDKIFPILEFRIDTFGSGNENKLQKINLHILFDIDEDNLKEEIKKIREEFISQIPISSIDKHKTKMLSVDNLTTEGGNDLQKGFSDLVPPTAKVFELLNCETWKNKTFTFLGYKEWSNLEKNNQLKPLKEDLYNRVNAFLSATQRETFLNCQKWLNEYGNKKLLHSGDIHDFSFLDTANTNENGDIIQSTNYYCDTWIKADTTFDGLKQIICEPEDRVKIQIDHPDDKKGYNIIEKIKFVDTSGQDKFPCEEIGLSSGLNTIIGGKSSGKSLLLHLIASEMGNKTDIKNYEQVIKNTSIEIYYKDDPTRKRTKDDARIIEFLPQLHIENLVRNQEYKNTTYRSLNEFIENLIKQDERIKAIFEESNNIITEAISNIESAITEWGKLDTQLNTAKEERTKLGDKKAIENEIDRIIGEINELTKNAGWTPEEKTLYDKLIADNQTQEVKKKALEQTNEEYSRLENYIINQINNDICSAIRFTSENEAVNGVFTGFKDLLNKSLAEIITSSSAQIKEKIQKNIELIDAITANITANTDALKPLMEKNAIQTEVVKLEQLKKEEEKRLTTIAEKDQQIKQFRESIANLNFVTNSKAIENSYYNLSDLLNAAIADKWSIETTKLDIRAKTVFNNTVFVNSISDIINMKSYLSNQFGADIFNTNEYEYRKENHCEKIAKLVQFAIKEDERFLNFKQGKTTKEFLLAILKNCFAIEYDIKKGSDSIHTMSEGKKGIVILQLYLSLSQADCPILIDQPEDNLDNRTVYQDLNDYIKQCKRKRQIIMVSHNANLVVNTDAENIIVANQTGENGSENRKYRFEYVNGSLENTFTNSKETAILYKQGIREHVCEILEGGVDAFKKREDKYHIKN